MRFASAAVVLSALALLASVGSALGQEYTTDWVCSVDGGVTIETCTSNLWSTCSTDCGRGSQARNVFCAVFNEEGELVSLDDPEAQCKNTAPPSSRPCTVNTCANTEWLCFSASDASDRAPCDNGAFFPECPALACGQATVNRTVGCFSGTARVGNNKCRAPVPATSKRCALATTACAPSFTDAVCRNADNVATNCVAQGGNPQEITAEGHCVDTEGKTVPSEWCPAASLERPCNVPVCAPNQKFAWENVYGECVDTADVCSSYRTVSSVCKTQGANSAVVDDLICAASKKKPTMRYEKCAGELECENGECVLTPVEDKVGATVGTCDCNHGFNGPTCNQTIAIDITEMEFYGASLMIRWSLSGHAPDMAATIEASGDKLDTPLTLGITNAEAGAFSAEVFTISQYFPPGPVKITVTVFGSSATETVHTPPLCSLDSYLCSSNGICSNSTGHCNCDDGYSGIRCEESPCDLKGCSHTNSVCVQTTNDTATCQCNADTETESFFADDLCLTPKGCVGEGKCYNNGVMTGSVDNGEATCTGCLCSGNWGGSSCTECSLDNVCFNSVPDKDCTTCLCSAGYKAYACACRYATARIVFDYSAVPWFTTRSVNSDANMRAWFSGIQAAVTHIIDDSSVYVDVVSAVFANTTRSVNVQVEMQLSGVCGMTLLSVDPEMDNVYAALATFRDAFAAHSLEDFPGFSGLNTEAGLGLEDVNCHGSGCPRDFGNGGVPLDDSHKVKKHLRGGEIAGIVIVAIAACVLIALLVYSYMYEKFCFSPSQEVSKAAEEEAAVAAVAPVPVPSSPTHMETTADRVNNIEMATLSTDV